MKSQNHRCQLSLPTCIFVDKDQSVYVSDWDNHRVVRYAKDATLASIVVGEGDNGNGPNQLRHPMSLAFDYQGGQTSIHGIVIPQRNVSTRSLQNNNLVLIIKKDENHDDVHYMKLSVNQISFPIYFNLTNMSEITSSGPHLMTLLIFGFTHRLLWEASFSQKNLLINSVNSITFVVKDVSNLPVCLTEGYPCILNSITDNSISMCCSNTRCRRSELTVPTCGGLSPVIKNATIFYILPVGMIPMMGPLDQHFIHVTEKLYQSRVKSETVIKVINATIDVESNNTGNTLKYILKIHVSIITPEHCPECPNKILNSIESEPMPFKIPQRDGSSIILSIKNPSINLGVTSTTITNSLLVTTEPPTTPLTTEKNMGIWTLTKNMTYSRKAHTASVLSNGTVLVIGGKTISVGYIEYLRSGELYDPVTGTWTLIANMAFARYHHTASVLSNNTVLIVGGRSYTNSEIRTELYNPSADTWIISESRANSSYNYQHTASVLLNGTVLVIGFDTSRVQHGTELYHPLTDTWTLTRTMIQWRLHHTASVLRDGRVLIAGGFGEFNRTLGALFSAELYDPLTDTWTSTGNMTYSRADHTASVLKDGRVLIAGGCTYLNRTEVLLLSSELYDPITGNWTLTGNITHPRIEHTASVLPNGAVLLIGGEDETFNAMSSVELYDPLTGDWTPVNNMIYARALHTASVLLNGTVLVVGGYDEDDDRDSILSSAELYSL